MSDKIREEILEIVNSLKIYLLYQKSLGAFAYGMDISEEIKAESEKSQRIEQVIHKIQNRMSEDKGNFLTMNLFEKPEDVINKAEDNTTVRFNMSTEEKIKLLDALREEIGADCKRCKLGSLVRSKVVFGEGNPDARIMFIGEGPGEEEDNQGLPFVGRAGQLLTRIIRAMGLERTDVYIANVVKCRPPENRAPSPDEMDICGEFLKRQISIIMPEVIIALGGTAASFLLRDYRIKISQVRTRELQYRDRNIVIPMVATFHPSYVLRRGESPEVKKEVWNDIKIALNLIGMEVKK